MAEGWAKVEVLETGEYFRSWEYQRTPKKQGGWVLIGPHFTGEVVCHEGFLPLKEARRQARQTAGLEGEAANDAPKATRSETAQALQNYVALHKVAAVRYQLTQNPALALRLAVAFLIGSATNWSVRTDRTAPHGPAIEASVAKGVALDRFREEEATVKAWIGASGDRDWVGGIGGEGQTVEAFGRLLELSDEQVLKVLAVAVAETLVAGSGWAEQMGERLQIDMRRFWKPDETFFDLLTDKEALTRIAVEVGAAPSSKATGKELRGLIRRRVKGEGCPPVENWLPRYFEFPTQGYTARPVSEARAAYDRLARRGSGANPGFEAADETGFKDEDGTEDETGFKDEDADERGTVTEWDEAA